MIIVIFALSEVVHSNEVIQLLNGNDDFIYGLSSGVVVKKNSIQVTNIAELKHKVTALARYNDNLFIATNNVGGNQGVNLYKCGFDWTGLALNESSCVDHLRNLNAQKIREAGIFSMMVVENSLFVGTQKDGTLWRCPADDSATECQVFLDDGRWDEITGVDYDRESRKIYAATGSGILYRCSEDSGDCQEVFKMLKNEFTSMHVAYNAVWLSTKSIQLLKCPLKSDGDFECQRFDDRRASFESRYSIAGIDSRDGYLFVLADNQVLRCNPEAIESCRFVFSAPSGSQTFMVTN